MGLFKKKVVKEIHHGMWGHLIGDHHVDNDLMSHQLRCVEREGPLNDGIPVTFARVFKLREADEKKIEVTGWETFDQHPELIIFEGYLSRDNKAHFVQKRPI